MVILTLPTNGVGADVSTVIIPFGQMSAAYNNHVAGLVDQHDSTQIIDTALLESTTIVNGATTSHGRFDMIYAMLSGILGGSGNASTRYAARSTDLASLAATVAGASATGASLTIPRRDSNGGVTFGIGALAGSGIVGVVNTAVGVVPLYIVNAASQIAASILVRDSTNTITRFSVGALGDTFVAGVLTAGSGSVAVTDASGHVLSAALNTVSPAQGGTGVASPTAGYVKAAGGATAMATVATIPVGDGGTGQTSYTNGQLLIGNTAGGTLAKGTITGSGGIVVTNGAGTIALSTSGLAASGANGDITSLTGLTTPLSTDQGGTGSGTYTDGQLNIGNSTGNTLTKGTITASGGIVVTNGHGTITISSTGLAASGANSDITSLTGLTTPLGVSQGGTGGATQSAAQTALGVPSTTGVGATGSWNITSASTLAVGANAVTATSVLDFSLPQTKISDGAVIQEGAGTLRVFVNAIKKWSAAGVPVHWDGGFVDLTTFVPSTTGQRVYVLIELNSTANIHVVAGSPVTGPLADVNMPNKDPDATALAMVALQSGQTQILAANITSWRGPGESGSGTSGTTGSQVGHNHAIPPEIRITNGGLDEGFPAPTVTPSMSILVYPMRYRSAAGLGNSISVATTVGPFAAPASGYRIYGVYFDPTIPGFAITAPSDSASNPPPKPAFSGNQRQICYVHLTSGSTTIKASDDSVNGWIEDVRVFLSGSAPSSTPVAVSDGGTGQVGFGTAGLVMAGVGSTTAAFTTIAATTTALTGLTISPTLTPGLGTGVGFVFGGGVVATGTSSPAAVYGVQVVQPSKTGTGVVPIYVGLFSSSGALATQGYAAQFATGAVSGVAILTDGLSGQVGDLQTYRVNNVVVGRRTANGSVTAGGAHAAGATVHAVTQTTGTIGTIVDSPTGQTANLQSWRVNGVELAGIGPGGGFSQSGTMAATGASLSGIAQGQNLKPATTSGTARWITAVGAGRVDMSALTAIGDHVTEAAGIYVPAVQRSGVHTTSLDQYDQYFLATSNGGATSGGTFTISDDLGHTSLSISFSAVAGDISGGTVGTVNNALAANLVTYRATGGPLNGGVSFVLISTIPGRRPAPTVTPTGITTVSPSGGTLTILTDVLAQPSVSSGYGIKVDQPQWNANNTGIYVSGNLSQAGSPIAGSANEYMLRMDGTVPVTGSLNGYQKNGIGTYMTTLEGTIAGVEHDVVAGDFQVFVTNGATNANAWALHLQVNNAGFGPGTGATGTGILIEGQLVNYSAADDGRIDSGTTNHQIGINMSTGLPVSVPATSGLQNNTAAFVVSAVNLDVSGATKPYWHQGFFVATRVANGGAGVGGGATDTAFELQDQWAVFLGGYMSVGSTTRNTTYMIDVASKPIRVQTAGSSIALETWTNVAGGVGFSAPWADFGAPFSSVSYMKDAMGIVHLRGVLKSGTINTAAFTLPAGYRPAGIESFAVVSNNAFGMVQVANSGIVTPVIGNNATVFLDGITFDTR